MGAELPVLLAARLGEVLWVVLRADDDLEWGILLNERGNVEGERRVSAAVAASEVTIHPDAGAVINSAEMQQEACVWLPVSERNGSSIPAGPKKGRVADAARRRFGREGDIDGGRPRHLRREGPQTVRVHGE